MKRRRSYGRFFIFIILLLICMILYSINNEKNLLNSIIYNDENGDINLVEQDYDKNISVSIVNFDTFNPILTKNNDIINLSNLVYDSLFYYDSEMNLKSNLVDEYNYNANVLYIRIKKGILWSNGTEFTTDDIGFTIDMIKQYGGIYYSAIDGIDSIEIVDNLNMKIILEKENNLKHYSLVFPIVNKAYYENENFELTTKNNIPVSTGMFRYGEKISDKQYVYKRNAFLNNNNSKVEQITVNIYSTTGEAFANIKNKKVDIINTSLNNYEDYIGTIGYSKLEYTSGKFLCIGINKDNNYLANLNTRKAINDVINKQVIWESIYNSKGIISQSNVYPNSKLYNNEEYLYDIDIAKQELVNSNINTNISLSLVIKNDDQNNEIAKILKDQLTKLNISLNIISVSSQDYFSRLQNKNYDLILVNFDLPRTIDLDMYTSDKYYGLFNLKNEDINQKALNINDEVSLKELYSEIQTLIVNEIPYIGIGFEKNSILTNNNLIGLNNASYMNIYYDINSIYKKK